MATVPADVGRRHRRPPAACRVAPAPDARTPVPLPRGAVRDKAGRNTAEPHPASPGPASAQVDGEAARPLGPSREGRVQGRPTPGGAVPVAVGEARRRRPHPPTEAAVVAVPPAPDGPKGCVPATVEAAAEPARRRAGGAAVARMATADGVAPAGARVARPVPTVRTAAGASADAVAAAVAQTPTQTRGPVAVRSSSATLKRDWEVGRRPVCTLLSVHRLFFF